ncbi:50S ribosomal protein L4 [Paradevosia shaoguanensis]|jgi:large subunit ribosomal protein L4|uniref:Large ribosomal subunit protein uL4 n=1 Tax=Paradevosia shaoguanensis TaxID=1335043 RepID=A0AA41QN02_9HYPH|nr:50S ribosomal protein L4 [Paradevosia shaoguanensis]KFL28623.1 50S ribosomal protein L4 [Devosia sp. 17-2-E-8]MBI4048116.1 50S ribosomal protein L4 [Devosia nanyangense]QMV01626.1 50S ribosomal protein L4 [Devosia sp. D6-9]MCF1742965.1 50S ribosomal protein L4 [Paradevosia shaoguanensis]MCI0127448.1 50S ribosomal protein L4 [Paradevosia shaoguanensis]
MELQITNLDGKGVGSVTLKDDVFGLEPRVDILHRMVRYQQLKAMAGTHKVKHRSEIAYTSKKSVKQKGSGGARHGNKAAPQFRGGGRAFGPEPRSHAIDLPKKVRALALKHALSSKVKSGELLIVDTLASQQAKTADLRKTLGAREWTNALIIDGATVDANFALAARNIPQVDVLPVQGINVVDILRRQKLVLTKAALEALEARFA